MSNFFLFLTALLAVFGDDRSWPRATCTVVQMILCIYIAFKLR